MQRPDTSWRYAGLWTLQVLLGTALAGVLMVLAERHNRRFDLTPTQSFVLSDEARQVAAGLTVPVHITAFYNAQEPGERRQMEDLLQLFRDASAQITYRLLDLDRSPALAKQYDVSSFNTGVAESEGTVLPVRGIDEEDLTNVLLQLTRRVPRTLCFVTGHGEHSPQDNSDRHGYSIVAKALEREHFAIRSFDIVPADGVPTDCTVVVVGGPTQELAPGEADQVMRYLARGGQVLFLVDPSSPPSVVAFLAGLGVQAGNDVIVDERNRFIGADSFMPRVPIFDQGTFRKTLDAAAVFAIARTVAPIDPPPPGVNVSLLALTSDDSWARVDGGAVPDAAPKFRREVDKPGPLPVAVMATVGSDAPPPAGQDVPPTPDRARHGGRMIVVGDSDFGSNLYLNLLGNKDLFMSSIGVLAEDEALIAVRRKGLPRSSFSPVSLTAEQGRAIFWLAVVVQPIAFAVLGMGIVWQRRRRASR